MEQRQITVTLTESELEDILFCLDCDTVKVVHVYREKDYRDYYELLARDQAR